MRRYTYRVQVAYVGSAFAGFAFVPGERTVWSVLRTALIGVAPGFGHLASGGRTDRGANATGQVMSFIATERVELDAIAEAIDRASPGELAALEVRRVSDSFHAQFSASYRRYVYLHPGEADARKLDRMLASLTGRRDFNAFARDTPPGKKTVRTLYEAGARASPEGVRFDFAGDAFLRRQLRVIVATALREAVRGASDDILVELARQNDRRLTAQPAPPEHLYLTKVGYEPITKRRPLL